MLIVGLTGSIGMGKSNAAAALRRLGLPVYDADAMVHGLLAGTGAGAGARGGEVVPAIAAAFPGIVRDGVVDRQALGARVFGDTDALARLEAITHPLVREKQRAFLRAAALRREAMVVLDIPLLFETGGERRCDASILVTAPAFLQAQRVLARPGMTAAKFAGIRARQMSETDKRRRADFVVLTGLDKGRTLRALRRIVTLLRQRPGRHWPRNRRAWPGPRPEPRRPGKGRTGDRRHA